MEGYKSWKKNVGIHLAVPLYRGFCKENRLNFHFADEKYSGVSSDQLTQLLLEEMALHGSALSLFNYKNKKYHTLDNQIVSFSYNSWDDFNIERYSIPEVCDMLIKKDEEINRLKLQADIYGPFALISSIVSTIVIVRQLNNPTLLAATVLVVTITIALLPSFIQKYRVIKDATMYKNKIIDLQSKLAKIHTKYTS